MTTSDWCRMITLSNVFVFVTMLMSTSSAFVVPMSSGRSQSATMKFGLRSRKHNRETSAHSSTISPGGLKAKLEGFDLSDRRSIPLDNLAQRGEDGVSPHGYTAVLVVPTGIGAAIGGFAGDALPVARAISSVVDTLVTHPNVVNGAMMYWPMDNMLYTEGWVLDRFAQGDLGLLPVKTGGHRIGLILDKAMSPELITYHLQVANAARATLGINVADYVITDAPVGVSLTIAQSGASEGKLDNMETLVEAGRRLIEEAHCTALAVICRFPEDDDQEAESLTRSYLEGKGVDPVGGAEALISHTLSRELGVPCAHAPANDIPSAPDPSVAPKVCAEELGFTFLPCVLAYLHRAPAIVRPEDDPRSSHALWSRHVDAIVLPHTACNSPAALHLGKSTKALVITVRENESCMADSAADMGLDHVLVDNYLEALGALAAHKAGVNLAALTSHISPIRQLR